jgi:hypothetical protein
LAGALVLPGGARRRAFSDLSVCFTTIYLYGGRPPWPAVAAGHGGPVCRDSAVARAPWRPRHGVVRIAPGLGPA